MRSVALYVVMTQIFLMMSVAATNDRMFWYVSGNFLLSQCSAQCNDTAPGGREGRLAMIRSAADNTRAYQAMQVADPTAHSGFLSGYRFNNTCENSGQWLWNSISDLDAEFFYKFSAASNYTGTCVGFCNFAAGEPNGYCNCGPKLFNVTTCCVGVTCADCGTVVYVCENLPGETGLEMYGPGTNSTVQGMWNDIATNDTHAGCICETSLTATRSRPPVTETATLLRATVTVQLSPSRRTVSLTADARTSSGTGSSSVTPSLTLSPSGSMFATLSHSIVLSLSTVKSNTTSSTPSPSVSSSATPSRTKQRSMSAPDTSVSQTISDTTTVSLSPNRSASDTFIDTSTVEERRTVSWRSSGTKSIGSSLTRSVTDTPVESPTVAASLTAHLAVTVSHRPTVTSSVSQQPTRTASSSPTLSTAVSPSASRSKATQQRSKSLTDTLLSSQTRMILSHTHRGLTKTHTVLPTVTRNHATATVAPSATRQLEKSSSLFTTATVSRTPLRSTATRRITESKTRVYPPPTRVLSSTAKGLCATAMVLSIAASVASIGGHSLLWLQMAAVIAHSPGAPDAASMWSTPLAYLLSPFWDHGFPSACIGNLGLVAAVVLLQLLAVHSEDQHDADHSPPKSGPGASDTMSPAHQESAANVAERTQERVARRWAECRFPNGAMLVGLAMFPGVAATAFEIVFHSSSADIIVGVLGVIACIAAVVYLLVLLPKHLLAVADLPPYNAFGAARRFVGLRGEWQSAAKDTIPPVDESDPKQSFPAAPAASELVTKQSFGVVFLPFDFKTCARGSGAPHAAVLIWSFVVSAVGGAKSADSAERAAQFAILGVLCLALLIVVACAQPYRWRMANVEAVVALFLLAVVAFVCAGGDEDASEASVTACVVALGVLSLLVFALAVWEYLVPSAAETSSYELDSTASVDSTVMVQITHTESDVHEGMLMEQPVVDHFPLVLPSLGGSDEFTINRTATPVELPQEPLTAVVVPTPSPQPASPAPIPVIPETKPPPQPVPPQVVEAPPHRPVEAPPREAPLDNDDFFAGFTASVPQQPANPPQPLEPKGLPGLLQRDTAGLATARTSKAAKPSSRIVVNKTKGSGKKRSSKHHSTSSDSESTSNSSISDDSDL